MRAARGDIATDEVTSEWHLAYGVTQLGLIGLSLTRQNPVVPAHAG